MNRKANIIPKAALFPVTTTVDDKGHLAIGGCDSVALAKEFGTPLYIFDEATIRQQCQSFRQEFGQRHADSLVIYACKAFINRALAVLLNEEGLGLDVVSGGELSVAQSVEFPPEQVYFHGNNKLPEELELALRWGIGRVVVDNFYELGLLTRISQELGVQAHILLRLSPGVDPHTHGHTTTGILDSKFGFPIATGQAEKALAQALKAPSLSVEGLHIHLGSPIFKLEPYREAIEIILDFAAQIQDKYGFSMREFSPGGGFAIQYLEDTPPPPIRAYAETIYSALHEGTERRGLGMPRLVVEPGRAIVGRAGVALYTVGAYKEIPGLRKYVSVDGGMSDNIRPAIYGARYEALVANKLLAEPTEQVTIAGRYCESGDVLIKDIMLPHLEAGDILAVPASGAYCLAMASNYNASLKPAIVLVNGGQARLIRRRETYDDLMRCDVL